MAVLEETNEFLDSEIRFHDRHRFEIKLDLELSSREKNSYEVETYFFVPKALNIGPHSYSKTNFYNNTQRYIRFKAPKISFKKLIDPQVKISPLNRIKEGASLILSGNKDTKVINSVYNEFKLLGCMIKTELQGYASFFIKDLKELSSRPEGGRDKYSRLTDSLAVFISDFKKLSLKIDSMRLELAHPIVPLKIRDALDFFDEYLSLIAEEAFTYLLSALRDLKHGGREFSEYEKEIVEIIQSQNKFRINNNYYLLEDKLHNEVFVYRRSVLKKFISRVLYLKVETSEMQALPQILFGLAAGLAMLFAVIVTIYAQNRFSLNSLPFVLIIVISYVFKDRIKEWLKILFSRGMIRWISDRNVDILDPLNDKKIGVLKEAFSFISNSSVARNFLRIRNIDNITSINEDGKPERVFKHEKKVVLFPRKILKFHERRKNINDIMRFNIKDFTAHADDSLTEYTYMDNETQELKTAICPRVYHINVIVKYTYAAVGKNKETNFDRIRIVLNQDGILRIEDVKI